MTDPYWPHSLMSGLVVPLKSDATQGHGIDFTGSNRASTHFDGVKCHDDGMSPSVEDAMLATRDDIQFARECQECGQGALMLALAEALAEEWPEHTPLNHVIGQASLGIADTAYTLRDLIADLAPSRRE